MGRQGCGAEGQGGVRRAPLPLLHPDHACDRFARKLAEEYRDRPGAQQRELTHSMRTKIQQSRVMVTRRSRGGVILVLGRARTSPRPGRAAQEATSPAMRCGHGRRQVAPLRNGLLRTEGQRAISLPVSHELIKSHLLEGEMIAGDHLLFPSTVQRFGRWYRRAGTGVCHPLHQERVGAPGKTFLGAGRHDPAGGDRWAPWPPVRLDSRSPSPLRASRTTSGCRRSLGCDLAGSSPTG